MEKYSSDRYSRPSQAEDQFRPSRRRWTIIFDFPAGAPIFVLKFLLALLPSARLSYVLVVHPLILSAAGMDRGALITVTALAAAIFTVIMGIRTNYPLAMAPGMGVNAFVAVAGVRGDAHSLASGAGNGVLQRHTFS